jgi:glutamine synthetase
MNTAKSINPIIDINSSITTVVVEYVWIDGSNKTRSKTRIIPGTLIPGQEDKGLTFHIDVWNYDGSSTGQSETKHSDIILIPRCVFQDPFNINTSTCKYLLCMCETFNQDGTPHATNNRAKLLATMQSVGENVITENKPLFGIEQEYVILDNKYNGYKWNTSGINYYHTPQGKFYCSVGADRAFGREIAMQHMNACIVAGIKICGVNAEVAPSQWEFQVGICEPFEMGDHLWMSRYILARVAELNNANISYDPKPFGSNWNGSGAHTNFSTKAMRADGGIEAIRVAIGKLEGKHKEHMAVYGEGNNRRMTGLHETSDIDTFTSGECDRGSSVRIPINVKAAGRGYFEDRRPASNADPYLVCAKIIDTVLG